MDNEIVLGANGGMSFSGAKAVDLYRIATLKSGLGLLQHGIRPTRGLTMTKALAMATEYTGRKYKRTESKLAIQDLQRLIAERKESINIIREE